MEASKDTANEPPALLETDEKPADEAPIEKEDDLLETTAATLKAIKHRFSTKIASKGPGNQQAVPTTETGVFLQEIVAKLDELENMINSGAAAMALKGRIPDPTAPEFKAQVATITTTAPGGPPEAAEPQPEEAEDEGSDEETGKSKATSRQAKKRNARRKKKKKMEKAGKTSDDKPAPEATASQTMLPIPHNPNFAANIQVSQEDEIMAVARVREDIERCEREGNINKLCIVCDKTGGGYCNGCKKARYCSKKCLVLDLPVHKKVCSDFAGPAADEKRPSPQHHRVLFFPTFRVNPEICWAVYRETADDRWFEIDHKDISQFLELVQGSTSGQGLRQGFVDFAQFLGSRPIGHMLRAVTFNTPRTVGENVDPRILNQSHNAFLKAGYLRPRDISPRDVHSIARLLELCEGSCITIPELYHGQTISGLLINDPLTALNVVMGVENVLEMTNVPLAPMDQSDNAIALAFLVGLRWYIRPCYVLGVGGRTTSWNDKQLRYVSYTCGLREAADEGGQACTGPGYELGFRHASFSSSTIILHGSGNPVEARHLSAFNEYLDEVYREKKSASKHGFRRYWSMYKQIQGAQAASSPSPYKWEKQNIIDRLGVYDPAVVMNFVRARIGDIWDHIAETSGKFEPETSGGRGRRHELKGG
ncbi:hypothetical protein B0I37DRAFT_447258 [Chaetomium sp. MPI-CAGE-AT-0009]|nr:hypothetical protein B0I37DRAFT_447258 [Chaetomium sp. MPI-CAGE-AT-0009]